ncbi:MAG: methylmalonyl Co-A mutase-associated GTPase MeaB [Candidatus Lambdaproteobacteria bacterium]|nr:methylmalonyl Co-A mutase-associated GTPase MeaB [Candidatus Lambdaproteobacteria bacterium]
MTPTPTPDSSHATALSTQAEDMLQRFRAGDLRALGRLLTLVENQHAQAGAALTRLYPSAGQAYRVGLTGAPGAGKSTLVSRIAGAWAAAGRSVAVLAMDPTSPFTGGALLGDRIRFQSPQAEGGAKPVFFRSAASRGHTGGLAKTTEEMSVVLEAFGYERLLIESVGVGQVGLDIAEACDTTVVIVVPESGDDIQALKAGLLEIADILVVNKCDRPGARALMTQLHEALHYRTHAQKGAWQVEVLLTCGHTGEGLEELGAQIERHRAHLLEHVGSERIRRERLRRALLNLVREELRVAAAEAFAAGRLPDGRALEPLLDQVLGGQSDPFAVARDTVRRLFAQGDT